MRVEIHLKHSSQVIARIAQNTYEKGAFYVVYDGQSVEKYPIADIWRIKEDYS